ncbi:cell wall biogenesis and architecture protein [Tilletia horrida]|nr:cell wall biogenesis and architecture protein [Tilletia horrida]
MASTRLSLSATRAALAALRTDAVAPFGCCRRCLSTSSYRASSWPVGASDDADDQHEHRRPSELSSSSGPSYSAAASSSSSAAPPSPSSHRTRAGPILERSPPASSSSAQDVAAAAASTIAAAPHPGAMDDIANARRGAVSTITDQALNVRSEALQRADTAVRDVRRDGKTMRELEGDLQSAKQELRNVRASSSSSTTSSSSMRSSADGSSRRTASSSSTRSKLPPAPRQKTIMYLDKMKEAGTPIAALTAYDYPTALSLRAADIDICLVGDSLANVALGFATTQGLRLDALIHHAQAVQRALRASTLLSTAPPIPLVVADMPFGTFQTSIEEGVRAAVRLIQEGGVDAVKIEGGPEVVPLVQRLTSFGIPVMGHVGLQPQRVGATSGYRVQGRSAGAAQAIWASARAIQDAGAFALVLECVPSPLARVLTQRLHIPTIGIGAGAECDGQILVTSDMLGELTSPAHVVAGLEGDHDGDAVRQTLAATASAPAPGGPATAAGLAPNPNTEEDASEPEPEPEPEPLQLRDQPLPLPHPSTPNAPKFVRQFLRAGTTLGAIRMQAVRDYVQAVRERRFPAEGVETYGMKEEQLRAFLDAVHED